MTPAPQKAAAERCWTCKLPLFKGHECVPAFQRTVAILLDKVGQPAACKGCGETIWWVTHLGGKKHPYDAAGNSHMLTCTARDQFTGEKPSKGASE